MLVCVLSVLFVLPSSPVLASEDGDRFKEIYTKEWAFRLKEFPVFASSVGVHDYDGQLGHVSEQVQVRRNAGWKKIRAELDGISCKRLDRDECVNYRIYVNQMDNYLTTFEIRSYLIPCNSDWGFYMEWSRLPQDTEFTSMQDYRNYLGRLHQLPLVMDEYIALMRKGLALGMT